MRTSTRSRTLTAVTLTILLASTASATNGPTKEQHASYSKLVRGAQFLPLRQGKAGRVSGTAVFRLTRDPIPPQGKMWKEKVAAYEKQLHHRMAKLAELCSSMKAEAWAKLSSGKENCDFAANRHKYWKTYKRLILEYAISFDAGPLRGAIETLGKEGLIYTKYYEVFADEAKLNKAFSAAGYVQAAVGSDTGNLDKEKDSLRAQFEAALQKRGGMKFWNPKAKNKDGKIKGAVARNLKAQKLKLRKYGVFGGAWRVFTKFGVPVRRTKTAAVLVQAKGDPFCRVYDLVALQDHRGGGRYGRTLINNDGFERFWVSKCK